ncbi:MAG: hypothetical protein SynsKO_29460 [Synoicihabitans sp.]
MVPILIFAGVAAVCTQLWRSRITAPTFLAQVEQRTATVHAPVAGEFRAATGLAPLQSISAGEVLGWIQPLSATMAEAELNILQRELDALQSNSDLAFDFRRIELESSRLQLEWMQARVGLATLQAQLRVARDNVTRLDRLQPVGAVPAQELEIAMVELAGLENAVAAQAETVTQLTPNLIEDQARPSALPDAEFALRDALAVQEARLYALELRLKPQPLRAPIDGVVLDHRPAGEHLVVGATVATIGGSDSSRIIGYERQPIDLALNSGDEVIVRSRRLPSQSAPAVLLEVSPTLEPVPTNVLALWRSTLAESGRRYQFSLPSELALLPGELVEISFAAP